MTPGTCSACGAAAELNPLTGHWWHSRPACPNRSQTVFAVAVVEDGAMRMTTDAERPARFVAGAGMGQSGPGAPGMPEVTTGPSGRQNGSQSRTEGETR